MILPDRAAETIQSLRRLAVNPTQECAQQVLDDWDERQQMYDTTRTAWTPIKDLGGVLHQRT